MLVLINLYFFCNLLQVMVKIQNMNNIYYTDSYLLKWMCNDEMYFNLWFLITLSDSRYNIGKAWIYET